MRDDDATFELVLRAVERCCQLESADMARVRENAPSLLGRYSLAQLRCRLGPALDESWAELDAIHVVLFGGTNAGKSTVLNLLLRAPLAGMRVTSRYSQHLEAFHACDDVWLRRFPTRLSGYERHEGVHPPRQSDADLRERGYREAFGDHCLPSLPEPFASRRFVLWDVPDFSTEEAQTYMQAVMDAAGLADVCVFCVTDESYADDRGMQVFRLLAESGIPVVLVGNKLADDENLRADIDAKWRLADQPAAIHWLPRAEGVTPEARFERLLDDPELAGLRSSLARIVGEPGLKRRVVGSVLRSLDARTPMILSPLRREAETQRVWVAETERSARSALFEQYRKAYLDSVQYGEYNRTLIKLLELVEFPGIGYILRGTRHLVGLPLRLVRSAVGRLFGGPAKAKTPEHEVLEGAVELWLAELRSFAQKQALATGKDVWKELSDRLEDASFVEGLYGPLTEAYSAYRNDLDREIGERAERLLKQLEKNPALLTALKTGGVALNLTVVALAVKSGGLNWSDAVLGPLVSGLMQLAVEYSFEAYLNAQKSALKEYQYQRIKRLLEDTLLVPLQRAIPAACTDGELSRIEKAWKDFSSTLQEAWA